MAKPKIPDFRVENWQHVDQYPILIESYLNPGVRYKVAHLNIFLNEKTGELGTEINIYSYTKFKELKHYPYFTCWEKLLKIDDENKLLFYIAYHQDGDWYVKRISPTSGAKFDIKLNKQGRPMNITVSFGLTIGGEISFSFPYQ